MTIYTNWNEAEYTALDLIDEAESELRALTDEGVQMHKNAVRGKLLVVHVHGWDRWASSGRGGIRVSLRVQGQHLNRTCALVSSRAQVEQLVAELQQLIDSRPVAVPFEMVAC